MYDPGYDPRQVFISVIVGMLITIIVLGRQREEKPEKGCYYYVKMVTMYRGSVPAIKEIDENRTVGFFDGDDWMIVGSDSSFKTYESDDKVGHLESCVIPIKKIRE